MPRETEANLPPTNEGYGTKEYWESRYTNESDGTSFDWFLTPEYLLPLISEAAGKLGKEVKVLMLGCGNSRLSEVMYDEGYRHIVNLDYSAVVISQMKERNTTRPEMEWIEMDVLNLDFGEGEFDLVIDKGTMECAHSLFHPPREAEDSAMLTTKGDPWNPPEKDVQTSMREVDEAVRCASLMLKLTRRVLRKRPTSRFLYFTFGQPHFRKRYLVDRPGWTLTHREIGPPEGFAYFMYSLSYTGDAPSSGTL